ncbi:uncharacterized protein LOC110831794 [Zootermopsis nevadensis]|uniref:uncharacterized protein LOC110831794 n=1 Tax=Zootermopsis nevadensis TaxID=136037 RepID=UPI000B8E81DF|nr:uncharacterized protein LOC110831794 [Zootermopsis nevadensis]
MEGFKMALMLVLLVAVSYTSSDSTPSKWCAERCVNPTCHVKSREYCLKHPGSVYEPNGGWCGCCPGCIIYVDIGGNCQATRDDGFYVRCRNSVCNNKTNICEAP